MKYRVALLLVFLGMTFAVEVYAEDFIPGSDLRGYEPSYFMYAFDDDDHIEFKISVKYPLLEGSGGRIGNLSEASNSCTFPTPGNTISLFFPMNHREIPRLLFRGYRTPVYLSPIYGLILMEKVWNLFRLAGFMSLMVSRLAIIKHS